ncbi:MAG: NAD(P)-dependent oxidoreductase [Actinomycetota bacterium]
MTSPDPSPSVTATDRPTSVAVLGLGAMGSRMAARAAAAGHRVAVWNRTPDAARRLADQAPVVVADEARAAVVGADVVVAMVADDEASQSLWLDADTGVLDALEPHAVAVESSTLSPSWIGSLAERCAARERPFVEAPVVGSRPQAEAGALVVLAGAEPGALDRVRPVLSTWASAVRHLGAPGAGAEAKLAVNGLFATQVAAYAEMLGFLGRSGMPTEDAAGFLAALPITSPALERILGLVTADDLNPNFPVRLVAKDLAYLVAAADERGAELPTATAARDVFAAGAAGAEADLDIAGISRRYLPPPTA